MKGYKVIEFNIMEKSYEEIQDWLNSLWIEHDLKLIAVKYNFFIFEVE
jgi:hypothetical protein